jgi:hypothetical protein
MIIPFQKHYLFVVQNVNSNNIQPETRAVLGRGFSVWKLWDRMNANCKKFDRETALNNPADAPSPHWVIIDCKRI